MTVFEGAEETLETLRNNLVGFQWLETRVKIEFSDETKPESEGKMGTWIYPTPTPSKET